jgi:hypothetical protein
METCANLPTSSSVEFSPEAPSHPDVGRPALNFEDMPFTIRVVTSEADLKKTVAVRRSAYGRHVPEFGTRMTVEDADRSISSTVLIAESKLDDAALGTIRIQTNDVAPLAVEHSVALPDWCKTGRLAEATRLCVANGRSGRMVKMMLFKALFMFCEEREVDWLIVTARSPIDREYQSMFFDDVFEPGQFIPMAHVGGLPHRIMAGQVSVARQRWNEAKHPLYRFVFETQHRDIDLRDARHSAFAA